jgi:hypothetical protein
VSEEDSKFLLEIVVIVMVCSLKNMMLFLIKLITNCNLHQLYHYSQLTQLITISNNIITKNGKIEIDISTIEYILLITLKMKLKMLMEEFGPLISLKLE